MRVAAIGLVKDRFVRENSRSENYRGSTVLGLITAKRTLSFFLDLPCLLGTDRSAVFSPSIIVALVPAGKENLPGGGNLADDAGEILDTARF